MIVKKCHVYRLALLSALCLSAMSAASVDADAPPSREVAVLSTEQDRNDLSMTIYQNGLAMVQDARTVNLTAGKQMLAFENVSNQLIPASALFGGEKVTILQQVFDYALMSTENMRRLSTGKEIKLSYLNPKTGEETHESATIITTKPQLILKTKNGIQTGTTGTISFLEIPEGLSKAPALKLFLDSPQAGAQKVDLTYLTNGLIWKADYIAKLNADRSKMRLRAFATVTNNTEVAYQNTAMNVVAGDVPRNYPLAQEAPVAALAEKRGYKMDAPAPEPSNEALGNVQLFKLPAKVSIDSQQTRQFPLLNEVELDATEILTATHYFEGQQERFDPDSIERPITEVQFKNTANSPLPAGEFRLYEADLAQKDHLTAELSIQDIAENELTRLHLGEAYNIKVMRTQTEWKPILGNKQVTIGGIATYEITVSNASDKNHVVNLIEEMEGKNEVISATIKPERVNSSTFKWLVPVPAKGEATLKYTLSAKQDEKNHSE